tara:strand:+ start:146 stop:505 length:360 start_codon:yes stop_codon:yes gene_type:complete
MDSHKKMMWELHKPKKEQGNIWSCETHFTFYLTKKDEKKLLNYGINPHCPKGRKFDSFEKFNLRILEEHEILNFFKKALWTTFNDYKITNTGKPVTARHGLIGDKQVYNKVTDKYELKE